MGSRSLPALRRLGRKLLEDSRGAEIAEAAAVLPLMFMVLLGIFWFGQAFTIYGAITRAAEVGARAGAAPYCSSCNSNANSLAQFSANAVNAVNASLQASHLNSSLAQPPASTPALNSCISNVTAIGCNSTASTNMCIQVPVQLSNTAGALNITGAAGVCGMSVSFQYPYQFWLPFTSLNKQQIWLQASARVRMETR